MRAALSSLIWLMLMMVMRAADPASVRVAVISDADNQDLAALVTAELSGNSDISLVERDDLAKVGDELKLRQLAGSDAVSLGKLLGADGLLFLTRTPDGFQIRFTAVGLGYALFDDQVAAQADLPQLAKSIAHRVADYATKLKLKPDQAIRISVLNIRADFAISDATALERKLTLLLESRLSSLPEYVVLERRHAWSLHFENSLSAASRHLLQGAYVVDGTMNLPVQGANEVTVRLRLRSPGNQQTPLEIHGSINDLPGLAEKMMTAVQKSTGATVSSAPWQPQKEAREYLLEGIWGYQHNAPDAAVEALDSAEILGETAPDLLAVRIPVLCGLAVGSAAIYQADAVTPDDPHPEARIEAMLRAFDDERRYERENMESKLQVLDRAHSMDGRTIAMRPTVVRAASSLLAMLDLTHYSKAEDLRSTLRSYAGYDPLHGKMPQDWIAAIRSADDWSVSMEEEIAYYRMFCTTYPSAVQGDGLWLQENLRPQSFCRRFIPDENERRDAYFKFLNSLLNDPVGRPTGLLDLAKWADPAQQDAACRAFYDELWADRADLANHNRLGLLISDAVEIEKGRGVTVADPQIIALLHYELQSGYPLPISIVYQTWCPELFPEKEAPGLWKDLQGFEARSGTDPSPFPLMRQRYIARFGEPEANPSAPASLVVDQFWYPKDAQGPFRFNIYPLHAVPDGVWVTGYYDRPALYHVVIDPSLDDPFTTAPPVEPPDILAQETVVGPEALYVIGSPIDNTQKMIMERFDLTSRQWHKSEIPNTERIFEAAGHLYLSLTGPRIGENEGGVARYDETTGETTVLASSRRRPAQNQFDDRAVYEVRNIFTGPGGKPCVAIDPGETYYIREQPGPWQRMIPSGQLYFSESDSFRTLLYGYRSMLYGAPSHRAKDDTVFMVDPAKANPELWLGAPAPFMRTGLVPQTTPLPKQPAWSQKPLWLPGNGDDVSSQYGFRGNDLFSYVSHRQTLKKELVWYRWGQPDPIHIPLSFKMNEPTASALKATLSDDSGKTFEMIRDGDTSTNGTTMQVTPQGICFLAPQGFWFLSYRDIDAYLQSVSK